MRIGQREFKDSGHTYVMGILNVTPDSFSDGGRYNEMDKALRHVEEMITEGMDIVDKICEDAKPTDDNGTISKEEQPVIEKVTIID